MWKMYYPDRDEVSALERKKEREKAAAQFYSNWKETQLFFARTIPDRNIKL